MKKLPLFILLLCLGFGACETPVVEASAKAILSDNTMLKGKWKLTGILLGDVIDQPCAGTSDNRDITLEIAADSLNTFKITGQSAVNYYFATAKITAFDTNTQKGQLSIAQLGSTKIAGSQLMNECENRYYTLLGIAKDFRLIQNTAGKAVLHLGEIKENTKPTLDNGTYFIFEKVQ